MFTSKLLKVKIRHICIRLIQDGQGNVIISYLNFSTWQKKVLRSKNYILTLPTEMLIIMLMITLTHPLHIHCIA